MITPSHGGGHGQLRLLAGVSQRSGESVAVSACVIDDTGYEERHSGIRLTELVQKLWPSGDLPDRLSQTFRFLNDNTRHDFLILPQRDAMVVRSDFVRAFIEPNRVIFLGVEDNATFEVFTEELLLELRAARDIDDDDWRFDLFVVECIVCAAVTVHTLRLRVMEPAIKNILNGVDMGASEASILRMYPLKVALSKFIEQVRPLVTCLQGLVQREHDDDAQQPRSRSHTNASSFMQPDSTEDGGDRLRRRKGSSASATLEEEANPKALGGPMLGMGSCGGSPEVGMGTSPGGFAAVAAQSWSPTGGAYSMKEMTPLQAATWSPHHKKTIAEDDIQEEPRNLDDVLELWLHSAEEVMADACELSTNIEDATRFLQASMSYLRNRLLRLELLAMVATLALGFGALVSGIFGMNLKSGVDEADGWFVTVVAMIILIGSSMVLGALWFFSRSKHDYKLNCARFGNNTFFDRIDDDRYILSLMGQDGAPGADGTLPAFVMDRVLSDLNTPTLPPLAQGATSGSHARTSFSRNRTLEISGTAGVVNTSATSLGSNPAYPSRANLTANNNSPLLAQGAVVRKTSGHLQGSAGVNRARSPSPSPIAPRRA